MSMKESLQKVQKDLESAQVEIAKLLELVDSLEKTVGGVKAAKPVKAIHATKKASKSKDAPKGTATERVLGFIQRSPEGISTDAIIKQTGLERKTVYGVLNKAKKQKKVKSAKRGTYVAV
jgi:DNA invertase Pin-like site-specific DNA recombinase